MGTSSFEENMNKHLDVFISYRRSTGSQLARYGLRNGNLTTINIGIIINFVLLKRLAYSKFIFNFEDFLSSLTSKD